VITTTKSIITDIMDMDTMVITVTTVTTVTTDTTDTVDFKPKANDPFLNAIARKKKIELLKLFLSQMPSDESLTPAQALRKAHLRQKIQKLEARRSHWSDSKEDNCKRRKWEKKCKKEHKKHQNLSPEVRQQVHQLKLQIIAIRPELCQLRLAKKQKKMELSNCLETGCGDKDAIWQEILDLKVKMNQVNSQIQPLKQTVKDLKATCKQQ
jgi:chromosome segregation ATPase